jgi:hypothetical protein
MHCRFIRWVGALVFLSIFVRTVFYLASRIYVARSLEPFDWVAVPIGFLALYLSHMFFKKIFNAS